MPTIACIICECSDREIFQEQDIALIERSLIKDYETDIVIRSPFICSKRNGLPLLTSLTKSFDKILIIGCYSRAQKWLFDTVPKKDRLVLIPFRGASIQDVLKFASKHLKKRKEDRTEWFPVLDKFLCINCGQCKEFCLFGVYEENRIGEIYVANPYNCKDECPACARVCPKGAIIFPKCDEDWIAGADVKRPPYRKMTRDEIIADIMKSHVKKNFRPKTLKDVSKEIKKFAKGD